MLGVAAGLFRLGLRRHVVDEPSSNLVVHLLVVATEAPSPVAVTLLLCETTLLLPLLQLQSLTGELRLDERGRSEDLLCERRSTCSRLLELVELGLRVYGVVVLEALAVSEEVLELGMSSVEVSQSSRVGAVASGRLLFFVI